MPTLLHGSGCNLGEWYGVPLVVHNWADLQSVHGFRCSDNLAPNAKFQRLPGWAAIGVASEDSWVLGDL